MATTPPHVLSFQKLAIKLKTPPLLTLVGGGGVYKLGADRIQQKKEHEPLIFFSKPEIMLVPNRKNKRKGKSCMDFTKLIHSIQISGTEMSPEDVARRILDLIKYNPEKEPAVPIIEIAKKMDFSVKMLDSLPNNDSGYIVVHPFLQEKYNTTKCIFLSARPKGGKRRFVLAHEIGHYLFDFNELEYFSYSHIYQFSYNKETENEEKEKRVNQFASELLMPKEAFVQQFNKLDNSPNILSLANKYAQLTILFQVTPKAVIKRAEECFPERLKQYG